MKNMITGALYALLLTILFSCQPDEPVEVIFEETLELTEIGKDPKLAALLSDFTGQSLNGRTASTEMAFGTLDYRNIVTRIASEEQPQPNYTIKLIPPDSVENTLEHLVLVGDEEGYWGYLLQYRAADGHLSGLVDIEKFTGSVRILNFNRVVQSVNYFENGEPVEALSGGRSEIRYTNCSCTIELLPKDEGPNTRHPNNIVHVLTLRCICDGGTGGGGSSGQLTNDPFSGTTYLPGQPIGDNPFDGGGSGGGSGGNGRTFDDGIEDPGDDIGTININIPESCQKIFEDEEFMQLMEELDCNLAWDYANNTSNYTKTSIIHRAYAIFEQVARNVAILALNDLCDLPDDEKLQMLEIFQGFLDVAGFFPGAGEFADGANAVIYLARGDQLNAALSGISIALPVAGDIGAKGLRMTIKVIQKTPGGDLLIKTAKEANFTQAKNLLEGFNKVVGNKLDELIDDMIINPDILKKAMDNPAITDAWRQYKNKGLDFLARNSNALEYLTNLHQKAKFGDDGVESFTSIKNIWDQKFPHTVNPDGTSTVWRHHAVEQQVLTKYPGLISKSEMHSLNNLRGIPKDINSELHLGLIRAEWNEFYDHFRRLNTKPTKQQLLDKATEIDNNYGAFFDPPIR